ncbi:MAG: S26 family signal peptidase [Haloferacaceae archaeon]
MTDGEGSPVDDEVGAPSEATEADEGAGGSDLDEVGGPSDAAEVDGSSDVGTGLSNGDAGTAVSNGDAVPEYPDEMGAKALLHRFLNDQHGPLMVLREVLTSVSVVLAIGLLLFAISGVWPPLVAVESASMEPNMVKGDLILVTEPGRYAPESAVPGTGVVTYQSGAETGYETFGMAGSVIVFDPPNRAGSPIIHRARYHVEEGENWYDEVDNDAMSADSCEELATCPAPHDGFITKGDGNRWYDQDYERSGIAPVVHEDWVTGVARVRIPYLGWIRLLFTGEAELSEVFGLSGALSPAKTLVAGGAGGFAAGRAVLAVDRNRGG